MIRLCIFIIHVALLLGPNLLLKYLHNHLHIYFFIGISSGSIVWTNLKRMMRGYILQLTFEQDNKKSIVFGYQQELPTDCSSGKIFSQCVYNLYCLPFVCAECFTMTNFEDLILSLSNHMRVVCTLVTNFYWNGCPKLFAFSMPPRIRTYHTTSNAAVSNKLITHKIWNWLTFIM